jgi:glyoxylase-like metal-dependent hydrolase (beta-lactamase superfamily II)
MQMIFRQFFDSVSSTYTYLLAGGEGGEALIIDPVKERLDQYLQAFAELDLKLVHAVDTHVHADHVTALGDLRDQTGCTTIMGSPAQVECVSRKVGDGEKIVVGGITLRAMATPGHTAESFSFALESGSDRRAVFTGDVLLIRSTGRTDFQQGDAHRSWDSIVNRLFRLSDETLVYPAHDYRGWTVSSIGEERRYNPRLAGKTEEEYVAIMEHLELPNPKLMDVAVPANLACGQSAGPR